MDEPMGGVAILDFLSHTISEMKKQEVLKESMWQSSSINGVPQPIKEIAPSHTHGQGIDNPMSFHDDYYQDGNAIENTFFNFNEDYWDNDVGLYFSSGSYYDPSISRFFNIQGKSVMLLPMGTQAEVKLNSISIWMLKSKNGFTIKLREYQGNVITISEGESAEDRRCDEENTIGDGYASCADWFGERADECIYVGVATMLTIVGALFAEYIAKLCIEYAWYKYLKYKDSYNEKWGGAS